MSKPVDKLEFWKERLDNAKAKYPLHYSVFVAGDKMWKDIESKHREILNKEIKESDNVLDIGCGYGRASEMVKGRYTGIDFSPDFIKEAQSLYPNKKFMVADIKNLPFNDKEFNVGFMISVKAMIVNNLGKEEWDKMESELKRVCKKILVLEYGTGDKGLTNGAEHYETI